MICLEIKKNINCVYEEVIKNNKNYIYKCIHNRDVDKLSVEEFYSDVCLDLWKIANKYPEDFINEGFVKASIKLTVKRLFTLYIREQSKNRTISKKISNNYERAITFNVKDSNLNLIKKYLTQEEFEVLYDFYFLDMTNEEMGIKYNKPKTTIRDRRIRIQKKLKEALLDDGYDFDDLIK